MIGMVVSLTPMIGWAAPALWPVALAAAGVLGYRAMTQTPISGEANTLLNRQLTKMKVVTLALENKQTIPLQQELARDEVMQFSQDDIILSIGKDLREHFYIRVATTGDRTTAELKRLGEQFAAHVMQQFTYNRIMEEMEQRGLVVVAEEVNAEGEIVIRSRRWD